MHPFSFPRSGGAPLAGMCLQVFVMYTSFSVALHSLVDFGQKF